MSSMMSDNNNSHVYGYTAQGWENIRCVFEQNLIDGLDIGASLCIYYQGKCVVDLCGGWKDEQTKKEPYTPYTPDTLQVVYSTSKGITAAAIGLCVERGWLDYDTPVAQYWPEFASNGKQNITLSDVMAHRAGLPFVDEELTQEDAYNWSRMTSLLAAQKPHWEPGTAHGYHAHTIGYIAGELIRRVDPHHRSYGQFIRDELDNEFYVGIPDDETEARVAPLIRKVVDTSNVRQSHPQTIKAFTCNGAFPLGKSKSIYNEPRLHCAELPSSNGITNARSLARIYSLLIGDIDDNGGKRKRLLSDKTLGEATKNVTPIGELDQNWYNLPTIFGKGGFQLCCEYFNIFGEGVFGHTVTVYLFEFKIGFGGSCAFAFPPYQLSYGYVCNQLDPSALNVDPRSIRIIQAIECILSSQNK